MSSSACPVATRATSSCAPSPADAWACVVWAGITALINQYMHQRGLPPVGFLNPALYQIAAHPDPAVAFHDITDGTNLHYPATPGYDMASGLGTPDVENLAQNILVTQKVIE